MTDILVTGTDTGVGKTIVAAALILALRERGERAIGFKPVETGVTIDSLADAVILAKASGVDEPLARPLVSLTEPLTPALAAERARVRIDPQAIAARMQALRQAGYRVIVEGAGGLLSPLTWDLTARDLALAHRLDAIVVARAGLGTLNHSLLTFEALRGKRVPIRGFVLSADTPATSLAQQTNPEVLTRLLPAIPIVFLPHQAIDDPLELAYLFAPQLTAFAY
ncbi:MAG: dethiobiotin synthase [Vicinamibacteria bacterium]|jgi:dethiobiotin synthetase|nr:dethiobiotin synthase [Vicinamibacteria bacterium]